MEAEALPHFGDVPLVDSDTQDVFDRFPTCTEFCRDFDAFSRAMESLLRGHLLKRGVQAADCDDLIQVMWMRIFRARRFQFQSESAFRGYLYRTLINLSNDFMKNRGREGFRRLAVAGISPTDIDHDALGTMTAEHDTSPDIQVSRSRFPEELVRAMADLSDEYRRVLVLAGEGLKYTEIAKHEGVPLGTVMSRLHRARAKLASHRERLFQVVEK